MRSTLVFVTGMLVGVLLSWASGPASMYLARGWSALRLVETPSGIVPSLKSVQDDNFAMGRPSASVLRRPVTRSVRMAASNVILVREAAVSSNATGAHASATAPVGPGAPAVAANATVGPAAEPSAAPLPESVHAAKAGLKTAAPVPDISKSKSGSSKSESGISKARPVTPRPDRAVKAKASAASADALKKKAAAEISPEQEYGRALKSYQNGRHALAREQFAAFMRDFPRHKLLPNALYWTGETWYAEARYDRAMEYFTQVVEDHPRHAKSADALLKLAYSALRQGQPGQAGVYLQQLEVRYPDSPASRLGRQAHGRIQGCNDSITVALARG
ncbi:tol-pal system protein YbgF [Desulfomicrobium sp. ZS1]|uniref:tol-pal system protein YbgF n=1 Tax=Desulfomicrobium sp. ZS1 TaxID=2952228 RepID=UPI0020B3F1D3|nr:tol-pal system protein YbgF [Desulfomicrobium sp. ZS1]UTF49019.1 tol-pal system protein YbgF [Desulfomicrobium sp. ZS1]